MNHGLQPLRILLLGLFPRAYVSDTHKFYREGRGRKQILNKMGHLEKVFLLPPWHNSSTGGQRRVNLPGKRQQILQDWVGNSQKDSSSPMQTQTEGVG